MIEGHQPDEDSGTRGAPPAAIGMVVAPSVSDAVEDDLAEDLRRTLGKRLPSVRWHIHRLSDGLVDPPADDDAIVAAARRMLLARDWDLILCLTDLPLHVARRPVVAHASPVHRVAILSVPALGTVAVRRRMREALLRLVDALLGESGVEEHGEDARSRRMTRRLRELVSEVDEHALLVRFTTRVLTGHLGLLAGMVRANRPWQLAAGLSRALVAAAAAGAVALVTTDIWLLADTGGWWRLTAVMAISIAAIVATLVVGAGLWERTGDTRVRQQVVLFNLATAATVLVGVLVLYAVLFLLAVIVAPLLAVPSVLADTVGHPATPGDYVELAWLTSSLATVGGALGAGLESDEATRRAAYTYRINEATEHGTE